MKSVVFPVLALFASGCGSSSAGRPDGDIVEIRPVTGNPGYPQRNPLDAGTFDAEDVREAAAPYDGGQNCPAVDPCGGNLVGTWSYVSACGDGKWLTLLKLSQPCAVEALPQVSGTVVYRADGTYSQSVNIGVTIGWDEDCLERTGYGCNSSCTLGGGICRCPKILPASEESGTYTADGSRAAMIPSGVDAGPPPSFGYCVREGIFYGIGSFSVGSAGGGLSSVTESGYVTAVKAD